MVNPRQLISTLRSRSLRSRTGVLGLPQVMFGREAEIAAILGLELMDYRERIIAHAPIESQYVSVTLTGLVEDLSSIANAKTGESCLLISEFDLAVMKLRSNERQILWTTLFSNFPHKTRALVLCVPNCNEGRFIFPDTISNRMWRESERYADWQLS